MTRDETKNILKMLSNLFPVAKLNDPAGMVEAWSKFFENDSFSEVEQAVNAYACLNKYFPSVGDIRQILDGGTGGFNNFHARVMDSKFYSDLEKEFSV